MAQWLKALTALLEDPGPTSQHPCQMTSQLPVTHIFLFFKVFESSEEAGALVLTIVVSGHFFISQGQTLLVGYSA